MLCLGAVFTPAASAKPTAIVGLGDSLMSGESTGSYVAGTDTLTNRCHRSPNAFIFKTGVTADRTFDLACSGAVASDLWLDHVGSVPLGGNVLPDFGQASQLTRLREIARTYDVKAVVVDVGVNDYGFIYSVVDCFGQIGRAHV